MLCFGPALYAAAGVALQTTMSDLGDALSTMLSGWRPDAEKVRNYLHWLACRQWSQEEIREGAMLASLVRKALG